MSATPRSFATRFGKFLVGLPPYGWLVLFFALPFLIVLKISLSELQTAIPPYQAIFNWTDEAVLQLRLNFGNYKYLFTDDLYILAYLNSVKIAAAASTTASHQSGPSCATSPMGWTW